MYLLSFQEATNGRLQCWNHDAAPEYLRTKLTPELEAEEAHLDNEKNSRTYEQVSILEICSILTIYRLAAKPDEALAFAPFDATAFSRTIA